jgi:hypothetical protein
MRTITRGTSRLGLCSALIVAAALAACGGSEDKPLPKATTSVSTPTKEPPAPAPDGHLSAGEYKSMQAIVTKLGKLEKIDDTAKGIRAVQSACRDFAAAPPTKLTLANKSVCGQLVRLLRVVGRFESQQKECEQAAQAGDVSCFAQNYRSLAGTARVIAVRAEAANAEVRARHLTGECASEVGTKKKEIQQYRSLSRDARGAALALEAKDQARLERALAAIKQDFDSGDDESTAESLRKLRACRS